MESRTPLQILVVEDDTDTQANIADILALDNYQTIAASTCKEALNRDHWDSISAILLDRKLPDGSAEEILPRLGKVAPNVPILVVTGLADIEGAIAALRAGAYDYILKPINADVLRASLRRIVEHLQVKQAFREAEERMRAILNTASDAIITIDRRAIIQSVNRATTVLFGYTPDELIGQNVKVLMPSPYRDEHDVYLTRFQKTRDARIICKGREVVGLRKDGSTFPVDLAVSEIEDLGLYAGVIRDISERKELQKLVLEIAAEENRRIGHELHDNIQQQLTGLGLLAQSLAESLVAAESHEPQTSGTTKPGGLSAMAIRLAKGIDESASEVHALSRGLVPVEIDAEGLRASLEGLAQRIREQYRVPCKLLCVGSIEMSDNFVATHLYRIVQEAVNNAIKHGRAKNIRISLTGTNEGLGLTVLDDGIGIGMKREPGAGMGLRIMQYRAGLIGATVQVEAAEQGGTLVSCTLSRREQQPNPRRF